MENQTDQNQTAQNSNPPVSPVAQTPPISNPKKSKFPLALIIGVILFLLVAGSAAGFYIYKQQNSNIAVKPTPSPVVQKQIPSPTADPTANWKTYTYNDVGFSIKLPTSWFSHSSTKAFTRTEVIFSYPTDFNSLQNLLSNQSGIDISSGPLNGKTLADRSNGIKTSNPDFSTPESLKLDGNDALMFKQNNTPKVIITTKNNIYYFFNFDNVDEVLSNQILSTFKFTDSNVSPTPTCIPRPACLDATPRCMIAEPASGWCPTNQTSCTSDADCAVDEVCAAAGPVIQGAAQQMSCWKKNEPRPL